ncbi:unnamed protein product [Caenorhabditis nigoni]
MFGGERRKTGGMNLNGRQSLAITPTKRFTDHGLSSVRKTDARPSMPLHGQSRPSLFQKGSTIPPRDVRSLQAANVQKIYNFFVETDGAEAPSERSIRAPGSRREFVVLFESMYQHLSKDYEYPEPARLEDEVTQIFKGLGYPYPLKNSYYQPMGASHGWPHLLDALSWLVDVIKMNTTVAANTQGILFGDILEQSKVQEKVLNYSWFASIYKDYTNDRKGTEDKDSQFWKDAKNKLRQHFENSNEYDDFASNAKNVLQQLIFDCDEIESERGQEQTYVEDIARMRDDIRKAAEYLESVELVKEHKDAEMVKVKGELDSKVAEKEKLLRMVNELKDRIEQQKIIHGCSGKEVRQMNLENSKDKEMVAELQAELDEVSKEMWRMKNDDSFKEQKAKFLQIVENITKLLSGLNVQLNLKPMPVPADEKQLKTCWETLNSVWVTEISRQMHQRKLDLDIEKSRSVDNFAAAQERIQIENEMLCEAKKKEGRDERTRRAERDEWKAARQQQEKRYDELENEKEVLMKKLHLDGSLEQEIKEEKDKMAKIEKEAEEKTQYLRSAIRQKVEAVEMEIAEIGQEKTMFHAECVAVEKLVQGTCGATH